MNSPDLLVFAPADHPRLRFVLDWMVSEGWEKTVDLTTDLDVARNWPGPKMAYSAEDPQFRPWIPMAGQLLFGDNTTSEPDVVRLEDEFWLFAASQPNASLPADLLAACFWMLSRWEEYGDFTPDAHDRYPGKTSLGFRHHFLMCPVVDEWTARLAGLLNHHFPGFAVPPASFHRIQTFDIDFAWRYLHKPVVRQIRTLARDLIKQGRTTFRRGFECLTDGRRDPYDFFDQWKEEEAVLFFPVSSRSHFDRNHSWMHPAYQQVIRSCHEHTRIGIHPGYSAGSHPEQLAEECRRFAMITGESPSRSRMHYLRFRLPETYRLLIECGIQEDWSMGFADQPGFRAGTARSFFWYDLERDITTPLRVHPFQVMDTTLQGYLHMHPQAALALIGQLESTIRAHGGTLTTLAHANSLAAIDREWAGWETVFFSKDR